MGSPSDRLLDLLNALELLVFEHRECDSGSCGIRLDLYEVVQKAKKEVEDAAPSAD